MNFVYRGRGSDLLNALSNSPADGAPLVFTGGDTRTELLKEPPRTAHDSLFIMQTIVARAGLQIPVVRTVNITSGGINPGDLDLTDTAVAPSPNVYGGGFTSGSNTPDDAQGASTLFAQVRAAGASFYGPAGLGVEVYGLLVELQAPQDVALPAIDFEVRGCSMGASSYSSAATGTQPGATWSYANATNSNIYIAGSVSPPLDTANQPRQRVRFLVLPAVTYNGLYYYTPFVCRPTLNITTANASTPVAEQTAGPAFPGRAVIHCRLNSGSAFAAGTQVSYQLLTRGTPDVENLIRRSSVSTRTVNKIATVTNLSKGM